jgi:hypothetical protein
VFANFIHRANGWMVECRGRLCFSLEAGQGLGVFDKRIRQKLQRNEAVKGYILCLLNHTHPAATQFLDDAVMRNGLANHGKD